MMTIATAVDGITMQSGSFGTRVKPLTKPARIGRWLSSLGLAAALGMCGAPTIGWAQTSEKSIRPADKATPSGSDNERSGGADVQGGVTAGTTAGSQGKAARSMTTGSPSDTPRAPASKPGLK